ncbi:LOW QUALITY PROTEIN: hypothetical protein RJ639_007991 [Escallonia herrerae]|uniref:VWFA domain-containing protein n=1 Tax=Escallonia herrerae TaxID=1293975 RepID=A0AA88VPA0_9ASTE|nr:LOW QUALITY PROTEIN: hypothetical protein RJ639_007991 [Escallonia herrerae]
MPVLGFYMFGHEEICGVCSKKVETRLGQATFTAECSCSFHLNCLTGRLISFALRATPCGKPSLLFIPIILVPLPGATYQHHLPCGQNPPCGHLFSDDEPLPAAVPIGDSTTSIKPLPSLTLKAFPELPALAVSDSISKFAALVGVQAPPLVDDSKRATIDLVAVLDVSGSMTGSKIELLKRAAEFVIQNLGPSDRLSIVALSTGAQRIFPLRRMNDRGREDAIIAIKSLSASGSTNIVEGLKKGVRLEASCFCLTGWIHTTITTLTLRNFCPYLSAPNQANREAAAAAPIVVHSFGFGSDHDAATLHAISDASGGTFSFIESIEIVQDAFAKCIGGLLSVVVQEVRLTMRTLSPGVHIQSIPSGKYFSGAYCQGREGVIDIGDLYADEEKDFLVYLAVPPTPDSEAGEETNTLLMDVMCSFRDSMSDQMMQVHGERVEIRRPEILSPDDTIVGSGPAEEPSLRGKGIAEAQAMADRGDLTGAQAVLTNRKSTLLSSASAQAGDELCNWLESELVEIRDRMASMELNVIWNYRICTTHKIPQILTLKIGFHAHSPILVVCAYRLFYTILGKTTSSTN